MLDFNEIRKSDYDSSLEAKERTNSRFKQTNFVNRKRLFSHSTAEYIYLFPSFELASVFLK